MLNKSIEFLWWDLKLSTLKILNCEDLVCFGRIQYIQNQTRESMHWCSFSLQQFFGSEFSEHQKGPFNWEGKTAAFWEFTTMVDIINLATNRDTLTAAVVQVHFSSKTSPFSRHIVLESQSDSWTFDILTNKKKIRTLFFSGSQVKVPCFFLKHRQKSSIQGFFSETENRGSKKVEGRSPLPPIERRGSQRRKSRNSSPWLPSWEA